MNHRDKAFEAFYSSLGDKGGIGGRDLLRLAWDAGRRYEVDRIDQITRRNVLGSAFASGVQKMTTVPNTAAAPAGLTFKPFVTAPGFCRCRCKVRLNADGSNPCRCCNEPRLDIPDDLI